MVYWLAHWTLDRAVRVRVLGGLIVLCSWAKHSTLTVPLSTQEYKVNCKGNLTKCGGGGKWQSGIGLGSHSGGSR